jgi:hypothetical protein
MLTDLLALILWYFGLQRQQNVYKRMVDRCPGLSIANRPYANEKKTPIPLMRLDKGNRGLTFPVSNHRKNSSVTGL